MKPLDRDTHILEHIVSYCQQIEETAARFGKRWLYFFLQILFIETQPLSVSCREGLKFFKGSVSNCTCQISETDPFEIHNHVPLRVCPIGTRFWFIQVGSSRLSC